MVALRPAGLQRWAGGKNAPVDRPHYLAMILLTGWGLGQIIERVNWSELRQTARRTVTVLLVVLLVSLARGARHGIWGKSPFPGQDAGAVVRHRPRSCSSAGINFASAGGLVYLLSGWQVRTRCE